MNGDQNQQTPPSARQYDPGDNPPSLREPGKLPSPLSLPAMHQPAMPILPEPQAKPEPAAAPAPAPVQPQVAAPRAQTAVPAAQGEPEGFYHPDQDNAGPADADPAGDGPDGARPAAPAQEEQAVVWTSSGDALRATAASWRVKMTFTSIIAGGLIYLLTRDFVSSGAVLVAGLLFGFLGARKPRGLAYRLDSRGLTVGQKHYSYGEFRAFSVADEVRSPSIDLVPLKRFLPILSLHFDHAQLDQIVAVLSTHLPMEAHRRDAFDKLTSKIRF